jgi:DNA mismatch repair protein MutS
MEDPARLTPMMSQYFEIKKKHQDKLLLFRLGDFYELFFDDAKTASRELNLTLTARHKDQPMCGVPYHALETYAAKLIQKGYKLAICDQVEDPKLAKTLVKREVTSIVTPGTVTNLVMLNGRKNNFLYCIHEDGTGVSAAFVDISTGDFMVSGSPLKEKKFFFETLLSHFPASEVLMNSMALQDQDLGKVVSAHNPSLKPAEYPDWKFEPSYAREKILSQYGLLNLKSIGLEDRPESVPAAGAVLSYIEETQKQGLNSLRKISYHSLSGYMFLDRSTIRNLELVNNNQDGSEYGSLLSVIDRTLTPMGARLLRRRLLQPLIKAGHIDRRLDRVNFFFDDNIRRDSNRNVLKDIGDLERLCARVSLKKANPKEMITLKNSLTSGQSLLDGLKDSKHYRQFDVTAVSELIHKTLTDDPSLDFEEGRVIRNGIDEQLDKYRESQDKGRQWMLELEESERKRSKINSLKIRYNQVFGYYIEITNANLSNVPSDYIRKQTLTNAERYTNAKLQEYETLILEARDKMVELQKRLYDSLLDRIKEHLDIIQDLSSELARLDADSAFAWLAKERNYTRPEIVDDGGISIHGGRHPVVEALFTNESFVPNDLTLNSDERLLIITGPNMAGKSTYLRQNAIIVLMAQMGSFVPASSARISLADKIFTRVGASDNLIRGESTFLVEMQETANILYNATKDSFIIMDEIGRGTSTYDGLSIAWSIVEFIAEKVQARTLFATHYHEMTVLETELKAVRNYNVLVREYKDDIVFLRKIAPGSADRSYGIQVAKLAGLPAEVIQRSKQILTDLETDTVRDVIVEQKKARGRKGKDASADSHQLGLFDFDSRLKEEIKGIDENTLTPVDALNLVVKWKKEIKEGH